MDQGRRPARRCAGAVQADRHRHRAGRGVRGRQASRHRPHAGPQQGRCRGLGRSGRWAARGHRRDRFRLGRSWLGDGGAVRGSIEHRHSGRRPLPRGAGRRGSRHPHRWRCPQPDLPRGPCHVLRGCGPRNPGAGRAGLSRYRSRDCRGQSDRMRCSAPRLRFSQRECRLRAGGDRRRTDLGRA